MVTAQWLSPAGIMAVLAILSVVLGGYSMLHTIRADSQRNFDRLGDLQSDLERLSGGFEEIRDHGSQTARQALTEVAEARGALGVHTQQIATLTTGSAVAKAEMESLRESLRRLEEKIDRLVSRV